MIMLSSFDCSVSIEFKRIVICLDESTPDRKVIFKSANNLSTVIPCVNTILSLSNVVTHLAFVTLSAIILNLSLAFLFVPSPSTFVGLLSRWIFALKMPLKELVCLTSVHIAVWIFYLARYKLIVLPLSIIDCTICQFKHTFSMFFVIKPKSIVFSLRTDKLTLTFLMISVPVSLIIVI